MGLLSSAMLAQAAETTAPSALSARSFEDAVALSKEPERITLIFATTGECEQAVALRRTLWTDPKIVTWVQTHGVAIELSNEKQPDVLQKLSMGRYPTIVAFRNGEELDRQFGCTDGMDAPTILTWLEGVAKGVNHFDRVRAELVTNPSNIWGRHKLAEELTAARRYEEAAIEYQWLWENMLRYDGLTYGIRLGSITEEVQRLLRASPAERPRFAALRDKTGQQMATFNESAAVDWIALNTMLGDIDRLVAWMTQQRESNGVYWGKHLIELRLIQTFISAHRWDAAGQAYSNPSQDVQKMRVTVERRSKDAAEMLRRYAANLTRSMRAAGREKEALAVAAEARKLDPSPEMNEMLEHPPEDAVDEDLATEGKVGFISPPPAGPFSRVSLDEALKGKQSVLVFVTATDCSACDDMRRHTWAKTAVADRVKQSGIAIELNRDTDKAVVAKLKVTRVPTMIFFEGGAEKDRVSDALESWELLNWLQGLEQHQTYVETLRAEANALPDNARARYALAHALLRTGQFKEAAPLYVSIWETIERADAPIMWKLHGSLFPDTQELLVAFPDTRAPLEAHRRQITPPEDALPEAALLVWWIWLNHAMGETDHSVAWMKRALPRSDLNARHKRAIENELVPLLLQEKRWADAAAFFTHPVWFLSVKHERQQQARSSLITRCREDVTQIVLSLRATHRDADLERVAVEARKLDPSPEMEAILSRAQVKPEKHQ